MPSRIEMARRHHEESVRHRRSREDAMDRLVESILSAVRTYESLDDPRLATEIGSRIHGWVVWCTGCVGADVMADEAAARYQDAGATGHVSYSAAK